MAITIPETEPLEFYSGETVKFKRTDLSDYPAPTWTLNYFLQKSGTKIDFASAQDGSTTGHLISLTPATTAAYTVGIIIGLLKREMELMFMWLTKATWKSRQTSLNKHLVTMIEVWQRKWSMPMNHYSQTKLPIAH